MHPFFLQDVCVSLIRCKDMPFLLQKSFFVLIFKQRHQQFTFFIILYPCFQGNSSISELLLQ